MKNNIDRVEEWTRYQDVIKDLEDKGLNDFANKLQALKIPPENILDTFKCQFLRCWLDAAFSDRIALKKFNGVKLFIFLVYNIDPFFLKNRVYIFRIHPN